MTEVADVRARRRTQTRAEILTAAWQLADQRGIAGLSMRELAPAVGMRAPSLYTYFPNKGAIYDAMFAAGYRELDAALEAVAIDAGDPVGTLTAGITAHLDFCAASVPRYQLMFTRVVPGWEPSAEAYAVSEASYARLRRELAVIGVERGEHLDLLTGLTSGLAAQQHANEPGGDRWRRLAHDAAAMFLTHVRSG